MHNHDIYVDNMRYAIFHLCRKSIYKGTHNIIHFNLCLSLVIGLVIFVSAIETAKDHEVILILTNAH